jgi:hypothetical protein
MKVWKTKAFRRKDGDTREGGMCRRLRIRPREEDRAVADQIFLP